MSTTNGSTNGINRVAQVVPTTQQEQMAALAAMMQQMQQKLAQQEAAAAALKAENEKLKAGTPPAPKHALTIKTGPYKDGAARTVCVYGLGRYPVSLYAEQWSRLLEITDEIKAYIESHKDELGEKK